MKLPVGAQQVGLIARRLPFFFCQKSDVQRRGADLVHRRLAGFEQQCAPFRALREDAGPRHRREWHRSLELGIVIAARPLKRIGPGMVEDIFALGMAFQIGGQDAGDRAVFFQHQMRRLPASARGGRTRCLQSVEEFKAGERMGLGRAVRIGAGVPTLPADPGGAVRDPDLHAISNTPSTSTATPRGREPAPVAARLCLPASPRAATIRSEAPLPTSGCWVKSGVAFTNTPSLTQRLTRSRSPPQAAFSCAKRLTAQSLAAALPSSIDMSAPSLPTNLRPSGAIVTWPEMKTRLPLTT